MYSELVFAHLLHFQVDCAAFGHLSQVLCVPYPFPQKKFIEEECPNLVALTQRIKEKCWPDWDKIVVNKPFDV